MKHGAQGRPSGLRLLADSGGGRYKFLFDLSLHEPPEERFEGSRAMILRPRTKLKKGRKAKRCPKCGALVGMRKRCKRCHKAQPALRM